METLIHTVCENSQSLVKKSTWHFQVSICKTFTVNVFISFLHSVLPAKARLTFSETPRLCRQSPVRYMLHRSLRIHSILLLFVCDPGSNSFYSKVYLTNHISSLQLYSVWGRDGYSPLMILTFEINSLVRPVLICLNMGRWRECVLCNMVTIT